MKKMKKCVLALFLGTFALGTHAATQTVTLTTSKAVGESMTLVVNHTAGVTVDWGDGTAVRMASDTVTGTLKAQTVTLVGSEYWYNLGCSNCSLTTLDLTKATGLTAVDCSNNALTALQTFANTNLVSLNCANNAITSLSLTNNTLLEYLNCSSNQLPRLILTKTTALKTLICNDNLIASLSGLTSNKVLTTLWCQNNKLVTTLALSYCPLKSLVCYNNDLTGISGSALSGLTHFWCDNNTITKLDLSACDTLQTFSCDNNGLTTLTLPTLSSTHKMDLLSLGTNNLTFSNFPTPTFVTSFTYAPQGTYTLPEHFIQTNTFLDLSSTLKNANSLSVTSYRWFDATNDTLLIRGSEGSADYAMTMGKAKFWKEYLNCVYAELYSAKYPDLVIRSTRVQVGGTVDAIESATTSKEATISVSTEAGALKITSKAGLQDVRVINALGSSVWNGPVDANTVRVALPVGAYFVNGVKVLLLK